MAEGRAWQFGDVIDGRYRVDDIHDDGGMGQVYRVRHLECGTDLAVKCPRPERFDTEEQRERFIAEADTWVSLGLHPNVCACHYVRDLDGIPRVFAEYVAGGSLRDWIRDRRLYAGDPAEALARILDIAVQIAWGLAYAHSRGVVHQDVKPGNVLLDPTSSGIVAKVADFGLARAKAAGADATAEQVHGRSRSVTNMGWTPAYASPEQARRQRLDFSTDVYSFAVSMLEMFTGGRRWGSGFEAGAALATRCGHSEPGIPELPPKLADLLAHCLRHNAQARLGSIAEVAKQLVDIYEAEIGTAYARPVPAAADLRADERNNRGVSWLDLGKTAEAYAAFDDALAADAQHLYATYNAGLLRWRRGECTDEDLVAAVEATAAGIVDADEFRRLIAGVHRERGDHRRADTGIDPEPVVSAAVLEGARRIPWYIHPEPAAVYDPVIQMMVKPSRPSIQVRFTGDGLRAVTVCDGVLSTWDVETGRCLRAVADTTHRDGGSVYLAITGDGRYAITAGGTAVRFWDVDNGRCLRTFDAQENLSQPLHWPNSVCLSGDGRVASAAYWDGTVLIWDFRSGELRQTLIGSPQHATAALGHDGRLALTAGHRDSTARLWEVDTGRCVGVLDCAKGGNTTWLSADANTAVVAGEKKIWVWDVDTGRIRILRGAGRLARASVSGGYVVSTDVDDTVRLWGRGNGQCLRTLRGDGTRLLAVHLDTAAGVLRSAWQNNLMRWWAVPPRYCAPTQLSKPRKHNELSLLAGTVSDLMERARSATDTRVALTLLTEARAVPGFERDPGVIAAWRDLGGSIARVGLRSAWYTGALEAGRLQYALAVNGDGRVAVSGGHGVRVWDLDNRTCLREIDTGHNLVRSVAVSADGARAVHSVGGAITVWSVATGERIAVLDHPLTLGMTTIDRARRTVLIARHDAIRLWNLDTGACELELPAHAPKTRVEALGLGSGLAASAGSDGVTRIWDLNTGECRHTLRGHTNSVMSVCLSPDDRYALTAGGYTDRTIRLWDLATGESLRVFGDEPDHVRGINSVPSVPKKNVRFSPDGRFAISGGSDTTVRIWDLGTGNCLTVLEGHGGAVNGVLISADASFALSASGDGTIRRWELDWELAVP
ncbi:WD40 repeat domain-containing serine/threonine protein kinase [Nocardia sp. NPDC059180]|uniref:WD40 repeat domain-containing serine/threonine protein kinase n=1 Tax=Nocardia sp. NPDC059180 TaxID=3346761 RepID=UPI0036A3ADAB